MILFYFFYFDASATSFKDCYLYCLTSSLYIFLQCSCMGRTVHQWEVSQSVL